MPKHKDLKRVVRSRMRKTGESYTAARLQVTRKRGPDLAVLAGRSDGTVKRATGKGWPEWVRVLDAAGAKEKPHRDIARYVASLGIPGWWSQTVTVGYERIRGKREIGQRSDGRYALSKSRTFAVPASRLFDAFAKPRVRVRWLPDPLSVRRSAPGKVIRMERRDGTRIDVWFTEKGPSKTTAALEETNVGDRATVERRKAYWAERFDALAAILR
ncbi:MAG TPA: hypothetical protein VFM93_12620 [Candidatus Limnocylindria bacterium]|nr:hypothetical protein [Candidatus Limnocylindria bacterium]